MNQLFIYFWYLNEQLFIYWSNNYCWFFMKSASTFLSILSSVNAKTFCVVASFMGKYIWDSKVTKVKFFVCQLDAKLKMYVCTREGILKSGPFNVQSKLGFLLQGSRQTNISEIFSLNCALHQMREWLCRLCSRCYVGHTHFAILENCLLTMSNISITFLLMQQNQSHVFLVLVSGARKWTDPVSKLTP